MSEILKGPIDLQTLIIREMTRADIAAVYEIEKLSFPSPWRLQDFQIEVEEHDYAITLVAEYSGEITGYLICHALYEQFHIINIAVSPDFRSKGIAKKMLHHIESLIDKEEYIVLEVRVSNTAAIRLYQKTGYLIYFKRKKFYPDGEDALVMIKPTINQI